MKIEHFSHARPSLKLEEYFAGRVLAWGSIEDRFGNVRRQFAVEINGTWNNNELVLHEAFRFDDGEQQLRIWHIRPDGAGGYSGVADDIIGTARGTASGNAFNWEYSMKLPVGGHPVLFDFNDWMLLQQNGVLLNRAIISKWGLRVAEIRLFFIKPESLPT